MEDSVFAGLPLRVGGSSPVNETARERLIQAIIGGDPVVFRRTLLECCPLLATDRRIYGVLLRSSTGMYALMVDETGQFVQPNHSFEPGVPIDLLNVEYVASEIRVTIGDQVWVAPFRRGPS
jgi:hypothetical protein